MCVPREWEFPIHETAQMPSRKGVVEHCRISLSQLFHSVAQVKDRIDASQKCHTPEPLEDFALPQICGNMEEQKTIEHGHL